MTGEHEYRNDITTGQHLTRHADRPYVFYFFPPHKPYAPRYKPF